MAILTTVTLASTSNVLPDDGVTVTPKHVGAFFLYFADCASQYIYLNIKQLGALNFIMSLFHASTCFEHYVLFVRRAKLYCTASGIITPIGGRLVHSALLVFAEVTFVKIAS